MGFDTHEYDKSPENAWKKVVLRKISSWKWTNQEILINQNSDYFN